MASHRIPARLVKDTRGGTSIEYGLIVALMVIGLISALNGVADEHTGLWATVSEKSTDAMSGK